MALALDIGVVAIILIAAASGYYRGFAKCAVKMLGTVVCIVLALIASELAANAVYEKFVVPRIESAVKEKLEGFDITETVRTELQKAGYEIDITDEQLREALGDSGDIPAAVARTVENGGMTADEAEEIKAELDKMLSTDFAAEVFAEMGLDEPEKLAEYMELSDGKIYDTVRALASENGSEAAAEYITGNVIDSFAVTAVRWVLFIIILIVAESVLSIALAITGVFNHIPVAGGVNRFFGLLLGAAKGFLYVFLLAFMLAAFAALENAGDNVINVDFIHDTHIFKYIYYIVENSD
ncbi:MAG: CvpA family protein [Oscillospiraceae bacterium]